MGCTMSPYAAMCAAELGNAISYARSYTQWRMPISAMFAGEATANARHYAYRLNSDEYALADQLCTAVHNALLQVLGVQP